jgi:uncharacterized protein (TIGR02145 family)
MASNVIMSVGYIGGNTGYYGAQSVASTGVIGLTATLSAGTLANGNGSVSYTITGTPANSGNANFAINLGGQNCSISVNILAAQPQYPAGTVNCPGTTIVAEVISPATGKIWMNRNLGATQVATSINDANSYGSLYQWGRNSDGHQCRNSATTITLSSANQPTHNNFILAPNFPYDWRSPQNGNLWQGVNGINNPCPSGYRIPSEMELTNESLSWTTNNTGGSISLAFASPLKFPAAGKREHNNGSIINVGTNGYGYYWSSTVIGTYSKALEINSSISDQTAAFRSYGYSVRCIKD